MELNREDVARVTTQVVLTIDLLQSLLVAVTDSKQEEFEELILPLRGLRLNVIDLAWEADALADLIYDRDK